MIRFEWLFLMQIVMGILMMVFLQKLMQMKKQMDKIIQEVSNYLTYITEDIEEFDELKEFKTEEKVMERKKTWETAAEENMAEESQSRIIQAVLREYFP